MSCWPTPPPTLDRLLETWPESMREDLRDDWLCDKGEAPRKVGRTAAPPAPLAGEGEGAGAGPLSAAR